MAANERIHNSINNNDVVHGTAPSPALCPLDEPSAAINSVKPITMSTMMAELPVLPTHLPTESDDGAIEYKRHLIEPSPTRLMHLTSQMKFRLAEGSGEALYEIGVDDNGFPRGLSQTDLDASLQTLDKMAAECSAKCSVLAVRDGHEGKVAEVLVRTAAEDDCVEVRIAVVGNVDAGKSSIIGTLTRGVLDNGRGLSRSYVFTHRHELETGRTSTISHQLMGFDAAGACVNYKLHQMSHSLDMADIVDASRKLVTFVDLCGHERYLKTTVRGMAGHAPDYAFIIVGANHGLTKMSREHLGVALALKLPLVFIVTKVDLAPDNILEQTLSEITRVAKLPGVKKLPLQVRSMDDVLVCARQYAQSGSDRVAPVFLVSSVTGQGLDLLRSFLNVLPPRTDWHRHISEPTECVIDDVFVVQGVGLVVSCLVTAGTVSVGDTLMLGPDGNGAFVPVTIKSIHAKRRPVQRVQAGCGASFALRRAVNRNFVRKGMVLCDPSRARAVWEFEADILVLQSQTTTIHGGYQPVVHVRSVRQSAKITALSSEVVRTGDRAKVRFRFMFRPEVVLEGQRVLFREGRTKGMGVITAVTDAVTGKTAVAPEETNSHSHSHSHTHAAHAAHVSNAPKTKAEKAAAYKLKR